MSPATPNLRVNTCLIRREEMTDSEKRYCSWCHSKTQQKLVVDNLLTRNTFQCCNCNNYIVVCRVPGCENMAKHQPHIKEDLNLFNKIRNNWANELCSEHNGEIADFEKLDMKLNDLADYRTIFKRKKWNYLKISKITGFSLLGAIVIVPFAYMAVPGVAVVLSQLGIVGGFAGVSAAILSAVGLEAAAGTLAVYAIGTTGVLIITAVGAGLGAKAGGVIGNSYFDAVKGFKINKIKEGTGPSLIFIDGFLSQENESPDDWIKSVQEKYKHCACYHVRWESGKLSKIGKLIKGSGAVLLKKIIEKYLIKNSSKIVKKLNPINWFTTISEVIGNPWHTSIVKASMTGTLLSDAIARTNNSEGYIIMSHSLGTRVAFHTLLPLLTKEESSEQFPVLDVFLLGGTVDRKAEEWDKIARFIKGNLINCYSNNDMVLKYLYKPATVFTTEPLGLGKIETKSCNIVNIDVSDIVKGHMDYKDSFLKILAMYEEVKTNEQKSGFVE